jgi:hypothetical protein
MHRYISVKFIFSSINTSLENYDQDYSEIAECKWKKSVRTVNLHFSEIVNNK